MKRIHLVTNGEGYMFRLAETLIKKGYIVSASGVNLENNNLTQLLGGDLLEFTDKSQQKIDCVVTPLSCNKEAKEICAAQELGLLVLSFPAFILRMSKDKTRVVVCDSDKENQLFSMILFVLRHQKVKCDYISFTPITGMNETMALSYDSRMLLLDANIENTAYYYESKPLYLHYNPHILVVPRLQQNSQSTDEFLASDPQILIERDGKLIYNQTDSGLNDWASKLREDITAIATETHPVERQGASTGLVTRYGNYPIGRTDDKFLLNVNIAKYTCRQLGINDKDFYAAISELSK